MNERLKKYISILTIVSVMFLQTMPAYVLADEISPSPQPSVSSAEPTSQPTTQTPSTSQPSDVTVSPTPVQPATVSPTPTISTTPQTPSSSSTQPGVNTAPAATIQTNPLSDQERENRRAEAKAAWEQTYYASHPELGFVSDGKTGDTTLKTGNANNSSTSTTAGNGNSSPLRPAGFEGQAASIVNSGNGAGSQNTGTNASATTVDNNQTNSAQVGNNVKQSSISGHSSTSFNVGNSTLTTGDSNVSGTAITGVNTNLNNVAVSEFNVVDTQKGDLVLSPQAFATNCISGCSPLRSSGFEGQAGNGSLSTNTTNAANTSNANTAQTNTAGVGNNLTLTANSGDNTGSFNTGGDTTINTGDANVSANSVTFANNNIAGGVTFGVVNIYGNLEGDIVLPEFASVGSTSGNPSAGSGQSGAGSTNASTSNTTNNSNTTQNNNANIANKIIVDGGTGNNGSNDNTNGNTTINTGKSTTDTNILNIANSNITDGTWWLVLVNDASNWVGSLLGAPDGAKMAGSTGTEFKTGADGQVTASNGAGSNNTSNISNTTNTNTSQSNNADINNTLHLSANTGGNRADFNTGGKNIINTGDSKIIANLINLVNNNISGTGKLVVTVVNVFGSWKGDFVTPGQQKRNNTTSNNNQPSVSATTNPTESNNTNPPPAVVGENTTTTTTPTQVNGKNIQSGSNPSFSSGQVNGAGVSNSQNSNEPAQVAGISANNQNNGAISLVSGKDKKVITINLAWLLLAIPFFAVYTMIRKRHVFMKIWRK